MRVIARARAATRTNQEKGGLGGRWKAPKFKAAWADIARSKFLIARPELVLIDLASLI